MKLLVLHPMVAHRTCADCKKYLYNPDGTPCVRGRGKDAVRVPNFTGTTPCHKCPKIPRNTEPTPENARELTPKLWKVYLHYHQCRLTGRFPDDPWVAFHAYVIGTVEEQLGFHRAVAILEDVRELLVRR